MLNKRGLLEAYIYQLPVLFFIKRGVLGTDTIGKREWVRTKKVVFAAEHTCTGHICECHPLDVYHNLYPY